MGFSLEVFLSSLLQMCKSYCHSEPHLSKECLIKNFLRLYPCMWLHPDCTQAEQQASFSSPGSTALTDSDSSDFCKGKIKITRHILLGNRHEEELLSGETYK